MNSVKQKLLATAAALPLALGLTSVATIWEGSDVVMAVGTAEAACNPCAAAKAACNPCTAAKATCNPCAAAKAACNPCAATKAACNPCAATKAASNPCSVDNPCAIAIPEVESTMSVEEIMAALKTPPKQSVGKIYSLDEIAKEFEVRSLLQAVEVKSVGFDFDKANVKGMEAGYLGNVAAAILKILEDRPDEVFFVEGHADAPGTYDYNLNLSKRRALHVKNALINVFGIPKKNVVAAGFGEKHLKITTDQREPANRRVTVRCITPLVKTATTTQ